MGTSKGSKVDKMESLKEGGPSSFSLYKCQPFIEITAPAPIQSDDSFHPQETRAKTAAEAHRAAIIRISAPFQET
ncbi:hypothetical protein CDAR_619241 [Caerostris darwini]|uniref:Uncharacterized protein n=1 Tax=Caerostris darwini TaxID=1538125 RepID=A0AAV4U2K7_9ARAC|nr:hypothetical protein CDAR_619241 [Caerostris darwini]